MGTSDLLRDRGGTHALPAAPLPDMIQERKILEE